MAVQVGVQGDLVQKARQGGFPLGVFHVAVDGGEQLPHVFQPGAALHVVFGLEHGGVSGADHHLLIEAGQVHGLGQSGEFGYHGGKLAQLSRCLLQLGVTFCIRDYIPQGQPFPDSGGAGLFQRGPADAPGRVVDDPGEAQIVPVVMDGAQVGQHILHLGPVKEPGAADDFVGDAAALEGHLQLVGLGVHPVEDRVAVPLFPRPIVLHQRFGDKTGLVVLVHGGVELNLVPLLPSGPQLLALAALVVADDGVGRRQNVFGGAVVLLQPDGAAALVLLLKGEDVLDGGPPEAVDGLVVVPHHADVLPAPGQQGGEEVLQVVGVLVLVDQYVAEFFLIICPYVFVLLEQSDGMQDDVVKVQRTRLPQPLFIGCVQRRDFLQAEVAGALALLLKIRRQLELVLGPGDGPQHRAGGKLLVVHVQLPDAVLHHPDGVVGVVDGEGGGEAQLLNVPAQDAHAGGVEGGRPHVPGGGAQHLFQPGLQLPGGLVGEGDGDDGPGGGGVHRAQPVGLKPALGGGMGGVFGQEGQVVRRHPLRHLQAVRPPAIADEVGHPVDEHRGLARARPRQQQQGSLGGQHGLSLLGVEILVVLADDLPAEAAEFQFLFRRQHGYQILFVK